MSSERFPALSRKKSWRTKDPLERILTDWYGKEAGSKELIQHLPKTESIKEGVNQALKKLVNPEIAFLRKVKEGWEEVAGAQLAKFTTPSSFYKGILYVEVSHPAWLMQLGKNEKDMLLVKVHEFAQNKTCRNIKFVPPGKKKQ